MLKTYHGEENVSFLHRVEERETQERWGSRHLFPPPNKRFCVLTLCSPPPSLFVSHLISDCILLVCSLPGHQKEDAADSQVGQEHEEPDSRGEGIQEGEVTRPTSLKHTQTHTKRRVKIIIACVDCTTLILCSDQTSRQNMACRWTRRWEVKCFLVEVKMK